MSYTAFTFIIFMIVTGLLYFLMPRRARWGVLLAASYIFYFLSSKLLLLSLLATTVSVYLSGLALGRINAQFNLAKKTVPKEEKKALRQKTASRKKLVVFLAVLFNFGLLLFFKYFNFFGDTVNSIFSLFSELSPVPHLKLIMPLGISYYTLQSVSYVVDVYRGKVEPDRHFGRLALFISFFPQIVEGPIGRYGQLAHQLYEPHRVSCANLLQGMEMILWGLFKKMVVADRAGIFVDAVFHNSAAYTGLPVILAVLLYTIQIYADFSGVMDIVRGVARLFGIQMALNFRRPFFSISVQEFWRRWHITLGAWLRDYVFYPVSLSKPILALGKKAKKVFKGHAGRQLPAICALFFVWFGNGLWHGAGWKFIVYGLYYYVIMTIGTLFEPLSVKALAALHIDREGKPWRVFQIIRTCVFVYFGMLIFRAPGLRYAGRIFLSMFRGPFLGGSLLLPKFAAADWLLLGIAVLLMLVVSVLQERNISVRALIAKLPLPIRWVIYFAALFSVIIFGIYGDGYHVGTFLYGQF